MSARAWSPEPWTVVNDAGVTYVADADNTVVFEPPDCGEASRQERADFDRAAACVSACAGIETEALAAGVVAQMRDILLAIGPAQVGRALTINRVHRGDEATCEPCRQAEAAKALLARLGPTP